MPAGRRRPLELANRRGRDVEARVQRPPGGVERAREVGLVDLALGEVHGDQVVVHRQVPVPMVLQEGDQRTRVPRRDRDGRTIAVRESGRPRANEGATSLVEGVKVREVVRMLEAHGWYLARMRGSHRQFKHASKPGRVTVPGKPSDDLAPGTLNSILKQAGLK